MKKNITFFTFFALTIGILQGNNTKQHNHTEKIHHRKNILLQKMNEYDRTKNKETAIELGIECCKLMTLIDKHEYIALQLHDIQKKVSLRAQEIYTIYPKIQIDIIKCILLSTINNTSNKHEISHEIVSLLINTEMDQLINERPMYDQFSLLRQAHMKIVQGNVKVAKDLILKLDTKE